jgi:AraC-like DNA-binding protein
MVSGRADHLLSIGSGEAESRQRIVTKARGASSAEDLPRSSRVRGASLLCGHFELEAKALHPLLDSLPKIVVLARQDGVGHDWVASLVASCEVAAGKAVPATEAILRRLSEILLIELLQAVTAADAGSPTTLGGLCDPGLASVLQAVIAEPEKGWSIPTLAKRAGMSRSAFVRRFRGSCGLSPGRYVTVCRMQKARRLLERGDFSTARVASSVGYASEAAFSRSFRSCFGAPPSAFRRRETP